MYIYIFPQNNSTHKGLIQALYSLPQTAKSDAHMYKTKLEQMTHQYDTEHAMWAEQSNNLLSKLEVKEKVITSTPDALFHFLPPGTLDNILSNL